jgi:hypothetical protein
MILKHDLKRGSVFTEIREKKGPDTIELEVMIELILSAAE